MSRTAKGDSFRCIHISPAAYIYVYTGYGIYTSMQISKHGDTYVIEWEDGSYTVVNPDSIDDTDRELAYILQSISEDSESQ